MEFIPISKVIPNSDNPRYIKEEKFKKLVQSLKDFPEMANARPIVVNKEMVALGGNMRLKAMQEAGWTEVPVKIVDWSEEQQREFIIKDNVGFGEWDWDELANTWNAEELDRWGLDIPKDEEQDEAYTTKIESPIYEPKNERPNESGLYNTKVYDRLIKEIDLSNLRDEEKEFLKLAATRHVEFDYRKIADLYAHSSNELQNLMENSALVIIDYDKAIELGFVKLFHELETLAELDD